MSWAYRSEQQLLFVRWVLEGKWEEQSRNVLPRLSSCDLKTQPRCIRLESMSLKRSLSGQIKGVHKKGVPLLPLLPDALLAFSCSLSLVFLQRNKIHCKIFE